MREQFGSEYNILGIGGCGTYVILGPTESGKTYLLEQLLAYAVCGSINVSNRIKFHDYIVISSTAHGTEDYKKVPLVGVEEIQFIKPTEENFKTILTIREKEISDAVRRLGRPQSASEKWAMENPIAIITDDTYGDLNMTTPNNAVSALVTKARHLGIYLLICQQYVKQSGPLIKENARAIVCLSCNYNNHRYMMTNFFGYIQHKEELHEIVEYNKIPMNVVVYYLKWKLCEMLGNKLSNRLPAMKVILLNPIKNYISKGFCHPEEDNFDYAAFYEDDPDLEFKLDDIIKNMEIPS